MLFLDVRSKVTAVLGNLILDVCQSIQCMTCPAFVVFTQCKSTAALGDNGLYYMREHHNQLARHKHFTDCPACVNDCDSQVYIQRHAFE